MNTKNNANIIQLFTKDVDELREVATSHRWNQDYLQLVRGDYCGEIFIYQLPDIQFARSYFSTATKAPGVPPQNTLTLGIPYFSQGGNASWYGHELGTNQVFVPHFDREHTLITRGESYIFTIAVDLDLLGKVAESCDRTLCEKLIQGKFYTIQPSIPALKAVADYCYNLFAMLEAAKKLSYTPQMQDLIYKDFLPLLVDLCSSIPESGVTEMETPQFDLIQKIDTHIMDDPSQPLTLQHLCEMFHTSKRSLHYIFQDCVGMSPMAYIKTQRLNGIHRYLKTCSAEYKTIANIAMEWGFWHFGRFSKDYKTMFGESPKETLRKSTLAA